MSDDNFSFLQDEFPNIYHYCNNVEKSIKKEDYEKALSESRKAIEMTIKEICSKEQIKYPDSLNNAITLLSNRKILEQPIVRQYKEIKDAGNFYSHGNSVSDRKKREQTPQEESLIMHHKLYNVVSDFYLEYYTDIEPKDVGSYQSISFKNENDPRLDIIIEKVDRILFGNEGPGSNSSVVTEEINDDENEGITESNGSWLDDYNFTKIKGSYLLGELNKLNDSSREAVEGSESLSDFKNYLHVKRSIEDELLNKLKEAQNDPCKLVILCGSVGDGKSHLIAHFNDEYPDLMSNFKIVKDATESDAFNKTSIETLVGKLSEFDDEHIENTDEKLILLINLGVLNNFIHSDIVQERYSTLLGVLDNLSIFDSDDFSNKLDDKFVSVVSFSDYYLFEFDDEHPNKVKSNFISTLFSKITDDNKDNPFYKAYKMDKRNNIDNPIIKNYELFCMSRVQDIIIFNIIKIIIKYKVFISTRELLNFIYEIIVPANFNPEDINSPVSYINLLLPNLLFGSDDRCDILKAINYEDPILKRVEITDELLIDLNTGMKFEDLFEKYMDINDLSFFDGVFDFDVIFTDYRNSDKKIISNSILRFSNIFGTEEVINAFNKQSYLDYIEYLNHYNKGEQKFLKNLISDVKQAIFKWKGSLDSDYLCIDKLNKFSVGKLFNLEFKGISGLQNNDLNRFKTSIVLPFNKEGELDESINLNMDYSLYEVITKLCKGYKPNNSEQKDLILFNDFIDNVIMFNSSNKCLISSNEYNEDNVRFSLEYYETFEEYQFRRL